MTYLVTSLDGRFEKTVESDEDKIDLLVSEISHDQYIPLDELCCEPLD